MIKSSHSRTPKKWLGNTILYMTGDTWIVLERRDDKKDKPLVCNGYNYNKKKILLFLLTKGMGSVEKRGGANEVRFPDKYGNLCICHVSRP